MEDKALFCPDCKTGPCERDSFFVCACSNCGLKWVYERLIGAKNESVIVLKRLNVAPDGKRVEKAW